MKATLMEWISPAWARLMKINRNYRIAGAVVLLVIIALIIWGVSNNRAARAAQTQTYEVKRGTLTQSIGGTGSVRASQSAALVWQTTGKVGAVNAAIGDKVKADQILASLDQASLPQAVIQAEIDLVNAQAELSQARVSQLGRANAEQAVATAQQALQDAQNKYDSMTFPRASDSLIKNTDGQITLAEQNVARLADRYRNLSHLSDDNQTKAEALVALTDAQLNLNTLIANYNWYSGKPTALDMANAQAALSVAKAQMADAERTLASYSDGSLAPDVATAQAKVAMAQSNLNQAKIIAPFSGIVTEADPSVGDIVSSGLAAFRVDNMSQLLVDVEVSEVDINNIKEGQPVTMQFDAIQGKTYKGKVTKVNLAGDVSSNAVTFTITTELTEVDELVKPGMSATVTILVKQVEDALLVPNRAIQTFDGKHMVNLMRFGRIIPTQVEVGAVTDTVSEIFSGLQEGDVIAIPSAGGTTSQPGGFGGGGGGPGFRIRTP